MTTMRYLALIIPENEAFTVVFPDFPGAATGGASIEAAMARAEDHLAAHVEGMEAEGYELPAPRDLKAIRADADYAEEVAAAEAVALVPVAIADKAVRLNVTIDERLLGRIDAAAAREGETRSGFLAQSARERLARME